MPETLLVLTTMPNHDSAVKLAAELVEAGLAGCVNIGAPVTCIYRWEGEMQQGTEVMLTIKTAAARYPALQQAIVDGHPYELPEVIAVPITAGLDRYLAWIETCTRN
jgi:periplasmic divalent cation tolerance protein